MIIADHHKPGNWRYDAADPYHPSCPWPEQCYVQWGGGGLVLRKDGGHYSTAFFEAFPGDNAGGFIRGEGVTVADAEASAFAQYQRHVGCAHRWCRKGYDNGGGFCAHCGAFKTVFRPIYKMGAWKKPISAWQDGWLEMMTGDGADAKGRKLVRHTELRKKLFGVECGRKPESRIEQFVQLICGDAQ